MPCSTTNETRSLPLLRPQPIANHKRSASSFAKDNQSFCWRRCRWAELMHAGSPQKVLSHFACRTFLASAWAQGNGEARDMIPVPAFDPEARLGRLAKLIFRLQVASLASRACNSFSSLPMLQSTKTETVNAIARRCKANCLALALLHSGLKAARPCKACSSALPLERICLKEFACVTTFPHRHLMHKCESHPQSSTYFFLVGLYVCSYFPRLCRCHTPPTMLAMAKQVIQGHYKNQQMLHTPHRPNSQRPRKPRTGIEMSSCWLTPKCCSDKLYQTAWKNWLLPRHAPSS